MSDYDPHPDDVTLGVDALDAAHEDTYHVHAAECCMELARYTVAVLAAVGPAHDKRVRAEVLRQAGRPTMGDHDYGTHDTNLCAECLGYAIGKRVALREAADDADEKAQALLKDIGYRSDGLDVPAERHYWLRLRDWLRARADEVSS